MRHLRLTEKIETKNEHLFSKNFETKLIIQIAFRLEISSRNFIVLRNLFLKQQILSVKSIFYLGIEYVTFNILVDKISVITSKNGIFNGVLTFQVT